jgi:hypothetical protein
MCDSRLYAEEPTKNRIQAFLDLLDAVPTSAGPVLSRAEGADPSQTGTHTLHRTMAIEGSSGGIEEVR